MTSDTGTSAVGGDVMLNAYDLCPGRNHVTFAAELTRIIGGDITRTDGHGMGMVSMVSLVSVAVETGYLGAAFALLDHLPNGGRIQECSSVSMAQRAIGAVQRIKIGIVRQCTDTR